jgi:pimeloyl-ACP methyl ester carboxylesterase
MIGADADRTTEAPWEFAAPWGARGYITQLDGPVHWIDFSADQGTNRGANQGTNQSTGQGTNQDSGQAPPIVFVHGLGGSHLNWCLIGPGLAAGRRAVAPDLHGFGLTPGTRDNATVQGNTRLLDRFLREITGTPAILVANSMGGLISILETAAAPDTVAGLVLIDPALPLPLRQRPDWPVVSQFALQALPGVGQLYVRKVLLGQPPQLAVQRLIELCFADPSRADPTLLTANIALARQRETMPAREESFLAASRSLLRVTGRRQRYFQMMAAVRVPVLLMGGDADRLVPVAAVRQAGARNPRWDTVVLPGVGHTPQLEVPDLVTKTIQGWLGRHFAVSPLPHWQEQYRCSNSPGWMPPSSLLRPRTRPAMSGECACSIQAARPTG